MKFVRFGTLKSVKQKGVKNWRSADYHKPPRKKGFYAMPYGYVDMYYIPDGWTDDNMRIQFLRAEDGRKLTCYDMEHNPDEAMTPLSYIIPSQLFSYHLALAHGFNPDEPVGLTKITLTR